MASISFIIRSDVYVGNEQQCAALRQIGRDWNWDHAGPDSTPEALADEAAELLSAASYYNEDGELVEPSADGIAFLRSCLIDSSKQSIQTRGRRRNWDEESPDHLQQ
jgi:hypothetical protein